MTDKKIVAGVNALGVDETSKSAPADAPVVPGIETGGAPSATADLSVAAYSLVQTMGGAASAGNDNINVKLRVAGNKPRRKAVSKAYRDAVAKIKHLARRFRPGEREYWFAGRLEAVCPRCGIAIVAPWKLGVGSILAGEDGRARSGGAQCASCECVFDWVRQTMETYSTAQRERHVGIRRQAITDAATNEAVKRDSWLY